MRPILHPTLVNGRSGDPAVYVEELFEKHAMLFDLGDISALPPRKIQRIERVFVSHAHIDHFFGFDRLLRVLVGRAATVHLYGPAGFIAHMRHKLGGYLWNLVDRYAADLVFLVTEIDGTLASRTVRFSLRQAFAEETVDAREPAGGVILATSAYRVTTAILDHHTPCLGFAVEEAAHVNVWKNRLSGLGVAVGPWLRDLKRAVLDGRPDDYPVAAEAATSAAPRILPLGTLRNALTLTPGQKIAYVTDVADTPANRATIVGLARNADILFIEAAFTAADAKLAGERAHLTTTAAGEIARAAGARRVEPFHFSHRYAATGEAPLLAEVHAAFAGEAAVP